MLFPLKTPRLIYFVVKITVTVRFLRNNCNFRWNILSKISKFATRVLRHPQMMLSWDVQCRNMDMDNGRNMECKDLNGWTSLVSFTSDFCGSILSCLMHISRHLGCTSLDESPADSAAPVAPADPVVPVAPDAPRTHAGATRGTWNRRPPHLCSSRDAYKSFGASHAYTRCTACIL